MANAALHLGTTIVCAHGGVAFSHTSSHRVRINGQPAITVVDQLLISNCTQATVPPLECLSGQFLTGASRVLIGGVPVVLSTSRLICMENALPLIIVWAQARVLAV